MPAKTLSSKPSPKGQAREHKPRGASARQAILVAGMHRSGTSALARVLSLRGAALPANVLPSNYGNPTGYWEPESIVAFNDRLLEYFGVEWDNPFAAGQLPPPDAFPARFQVEAEELLAREYADADLFVLKDPRCTLLHQFWRRALRATGADARPVVAMRPFPEVAESLVRRDGTSATSAALLYVAYGLEAASLVADGASVVTYAQLLADWRATTDRIAAEQRISWPISGARAANEIEAFLHPATAAARVPQVAEALVDWTDRTWAWFDAAAQGQPPPLAELDGIRSALGAAAEVFAPVLADRDTRIRGLARRADTAEQKEQVERQRDEFAREREQAQAERNRAMEALAHTEAELTRTQEAYRRQEAEANALRDALAWRERQLQETQEARTHTEEELQRARKLADERAQFEVELRQVRQESADREQRRLEAVEIGRAHV